MPNSVKSKFAGFLRGLLSRGDDRASARPVASAAPAPMSVPASPSATLRAPGGAYPGAVRPAAGKVARAGAIEVPLAPVIAGLPMDLRSKLMAVPSAELTILLPTETVLPQLAFGAVRISFGELRQMARGVFANSGGELDNKPVSLPLQEILPRLDPAVLTRRPAKRVEVSDDIIGPFSERGRGFSFTTQPLKAAAASIPAPAPAPVAEPPVAFNAPVSIRPTSPLPPTSHIPQRTITPAAPVPGMNGNGHSHSLPGTTLTSRSVTPTVPGGAGGHGGTNGNGNGNGYGRHGGSLPPGLRLGPLNGNGHSDSPLATEMPGAPAPAHPAGPMRVHLPASQRPAPAAPAVPTGPTIYAPIGDLSESWPDTVKHEIATTALAQAKIPLDGSIVLPGLKRGRVVMLWKQIRSLAQPNSSPSPYDNQELELPLKVIAPLFLAAQKNPPSRPSARASVANDIPDLFFGFPQAAAAPISPVAPLAPAIPAAPVRPAAPVAPANPVIPPLPKPPESQKPQDTNFYVWGENGEAPQADEAALRRGSRPETDFMSRQVHPKDVVARAALLPGVAGAVVAMQDGLRVASHVPPELNADTLAAFLPQIFERVNQSTRELRMGMLNNVNFTVGNIPWKIFRVNAVYFAAFGRMGEQLPSAQLAQLAADLDRKKL